MKERFLDWIYLQTKDVDWQKIRDWTVNGLSWLIASPFIAIVLLYLWPCVLAIVGIAVLFQTDEKDVNNAGLGTWFMTIVFVAIALYVNWHWWSNAWFVTVTMWNWWQGIVNPPR